jgi:hypothetical protein
MSYFTFVIYKKHYTEFSISAMIQAANAAASAFAADAKAVSVVFLRDCCNCPISHCNL